MRAGPLVGLGGHNQLVQAFDGPAIGNELRRQPVKQLWVRWFLSSCSEIIRVTRQATSEMILPHTVRHDPCGERVVLSGKPAGQRRPSPGQGRGNFSIQTGGREPTRLHRLCRCKDIAAGQNGRLFANRIRWRLVLRATLAERDPHTQACGAVVDGESDGPVTIRAPAKQGTPFSTETSSTKIIGGYLLLRQALQHALIVVLP